MPLSMRPSLRLMRIREGGQEGEWAPLPVLVPPRGIQEKAVLPRVDKGALDGVGRSDNALESIVFKVKRAGRLLLSFGRARKDRRDLESGEVSTYNLWYPVIAERLTL